MQTQGLGTEEGCLSVGTPQDTADCSSRGIAGRAKSPEQSRLTIGAAGGEALAICDAVPIATGRHWHHDGASMLARGLYAIVDVELTNKAGFDVLEFAEAVLDARPSVVQLRAKNLGAREHLRLLQEIVRRAELVDVPVFANDRPDLAILAGCTGVHVGQSDVPIPEVRRLDTRLKLGLSTATREQVVEGLSLAPDYLAVGPVYPTNSKADADPAVGIRFLHAASQLAQAADTPLVAIGGVDHARASSVAPLAQLGAAISALIPPVPHLGTVSMLARALHLALGGS